MDEKVYPDDTIYVETVIHRPNFNLKIIDLKLAYCETIHSLGENKLCATNTTDPLNSIIWFIHQTNRQYSVRRKNGPGRARIE